MFYAVKYTSSIAHQPPQHAGAHTRRTGPLSAAALVRCSFYALRVTRRMLNMLYARVRRTGWLRRYARNRTRVSVRNLSVCLFRAVLRPSCTDGGGDSGGGRHCVVDYL